MEKKFNTELAKRLLAKAPNMKSFMLAYNNTKGIEKMGLSTLYKKIKKAGLSTNFVKGSKLRKIKASCSDMIFAGISVERRLYTKEKSNVRKALGNVCCCCGDTRGLEIDHIDGNRNNTQINNLQLLCGTCHNIKHELRN